MRHMCPIHGCQPVIYLSLDVWNDPKNGNTYQGGVRVVYEFEGQHVDAFLLSAGFAKKHDVQGGIVPLPDEYPKWAQDVVSVCKSCFDERAR